MLDPAPPTLTGLTLFFFSSVNADIVSGVTVDHLLGTNYTAGTVQLQWPAPVKSNGMIVTYTVRYQRMDLEHAVPTDLCITQTTFTNKTSEYIIKSLENGNYSFSVMATSFAGPGPLSPPTFALINVIYIFVFFYDFNIERGSCCLCYIFSRRDSPPGNGSGLWLA